MKADELRKMFGKKIVWLDSYCHKRGFIQREGILLDVNGLNALVDMHGSEDWIWIPNMRDLKAKDA